MEKYENLVRLQKLKENGTLSNAEFEAEKQKILNNSKVIKTKNGKARILFILFAIGTIISIIISILYFYWQSTLWFDVWVQNDRNMTMVDIITNIFVGSLILFWGATIILLIIGIALKIKEKGGIKIVN